MAIKPIETRYKGYRFRSRLEARWAVFFDKLGVEWQYEPEGFVLENGTHYLPDFWLETVGMWAEVKPSTFSAEEKRKCFLLARGANAAVIMLDGPPTPRNYWGFQPEFHLGLNGSNVTDETPDGLPGVYLTDWFLDDEYLAERRFFVCTGASEGETYELHYGGLEYGSIRTRNAYEAARAARFEHGESP